MATLQLTRNAVAIVDDEDLQRCNNYGLWYLSKNGYAVTNLNPGLVYLHKFILRTNHEVDHRNGNRLDCQKQNLRLATHQQNNQNRNVSSHRKFKGVKSVNNRFRAYIKPNKKFIHLGYFDSDVEAAQAYNQAAELHFGEFANLNKI